MKKGLKRQLNYIEPIDASFAEKIFLFEKLVKRPPPMAAMVAGPMMDLKKEEKTKMYPEEWWWAERQVSEVLAEHPGELVKTGEKRTCRRRAVSQRDLTLLIYQNPQERQSYRGFLGYRCLPLVSNRIFGKKGVHFGVPNYVTPFQV